MKQKSELIKSDVSGLSFHSYAIRQCPHPQVIKRYGHDGIANVSVYDCRKCRFKETMEYTSALGCGYEKQVGQ